MTLLSFALTSLTACQQHNDASAYIKVYKSDTSIQCEDGGIEPQQMAMELISAGIDVLCVQTGYDGFVYPAVCGGDTGRINIYQIHRLNLEHAQMLGFDPVSDLADYQDQSCE